MTATGTALRLAARDLYGNSWRLVPLNALLGALLVAAGIAAFAVHAALPLVVLAGPVAAALVHCSVTLARTGNLTIADAADGLRTHWRRGVVLAAFGTAFAVLAAFAIRFYGGSRLAWPLAFLALYLVLLLGLYQALLWTFAVAEPERPLRDAAAAAADAIARRPAAAAGLGIALTAVNVLGIAIAVMPFLTLTVAYSFVAVAHFALPPTPEEP
jgi:hypothetical protein